MFNPKVKDFAKTAALNFAESTLSTTSKNINDALDQTREAIADGLEVGDGVEKLAAKIGDIFENLDDSGAELIAQTESSRAWHEGLRESAKGSGVVTGLKHLTTDQPCDICADLDGKVYALDDDLPPDNTHPNCLCALEEILDTETEEEE